MSIETEVFKALGHLFIAGVVYLAWKLSFDAAHDESSTRVLLKGALWCLGIALIASISLGTHTENCEDDPLRGTCDRVQDFAPTADDRAATFLYYLVLLYPPIVIGALQGAGKMTHGVPLLNRK